MNVLAKILDAPAFLDRRGALGAGAAARAAGAEKDVLCDEDQIERVVS